MFGFKRRPKPRSEEEKKLSYYEASQWQLVRRRFAKHRVAFWMAHVVVLLYVVCLSCELIAPYEPSEIHKHWVELPPQLLHFGFVEGETLPGFYVHPFVRNDDPVTLARHYQVNREVRIPIKFFVKGRPWKLLGLIPTERHLFGIDGYDEGRMQESAERGRRIVAALEAFRRDRGEYPQSVGELAPTYLAEIQPPLLGAGKWDYAVVRGAEAAKSEPGGPEGDETPRADAGRPEAGAAAASGEKGEPAGGPAPSAKDSFSLSFAETGGTLIGSYDSAKASDWELIQPSCFLLGSGPLGQDSLSRILYGGRISLLVGLTGVFLSFILGISLGGISGYYGGKIDMFIQRLAEILQSVPKIPIWLMLAFAIPKDLSSLQVYFGMTLILACIGWTGLCRVVRGKLLALREEDYAKAAMLAGASERRIIFMHLVPNFMSHIIASLTLAIPGMILGETSLSFLGLGLRPPIVSWGVLLQEANSVGAVRSQPWLLLPAAAVVIAVLAINFMGEGMRDAADPYST